MSVDQAAVAAGAADCELSGIKLFEVPDVWPPPPGDQACAAAPVGQPGGAPRTAPPSPEPWQRQFAVLLAETLTGARPPQQIAPWLSRRGSAQLHRLLPQLRAEQRPRVLRVLAAAPSRDVVEMTMVVQVGPRARALAVRLERGGDAGPAPWRGKPAAPWVCTDIEAG